MAGTGRGRAGVRAGGRVATRWLLGAGEHPGGTALTSHALDRLALPPGARVVDVACGRGATLALLASRGLLATGVEVEPQAARSAGPRAVVGDAHALPLPGAAFDAVLCECAVSTFDDPARAVGELARVVRPGGAVVLTDVVLRRDLAAPEVVAAVDRLTTALPVGAYADLLAGAGLVVERVEDRAADAEALTRRLARRLALVGARDAARTARACTGAVRAGALSYALLVARRPPAR